MVRYDLATPWQRFTEAFPWVIQQAEIKDTLISIVILMAITIYFAIKLKASENGENGKERLLFLLFFALTIFYCVLLAIFLDGDVEFFWNYGIDYGKYTYEEALRHPSNYYWLVEYRNEYSTGIPTWGAILTCLCVGAIMDFKRKK